MRNRRDHGTTSHAGRLRAAPDGGADALPAGFRGLDDSSLRTLVDNSFRLAARELSPERREAAAREASAAVREAAREVAEVCELFRVTGRTIGTLQAALDKWRARVDARAPDRAALGAAECAALEIPDACRNGVLRLGGALDQLSSEKNNTFDSGVAALGKSLRGFSIATFRKLERFDGMIGGSAEIQQMFGAARQRLRAVVDAGEPSTIAGVKSFISQCNEIAAPLAGSLGAALNRLAAEPVPDEAAALKKLLLREGGRWEALFASPPQEEGTIAAAQRSALACVFYSHFFGDLAKPKAVAWTATLANVSSEIFDAAIDKLDAAAPTASLGIGKRLQPLRTALAKRAHEARGTQRNRPKSAPPHGRKSAAVDDPFFAELREIFVDRRICDDLRRTVPADRLRTAQAELLDRLGTRDTARVVLRANPRLLQDEGKFDDFLRRLDATRNVWKPLLENGTLSVQTLSSAESLLHLEIRQEIGAVFGSIEAADEVLSFNRLLRTSAPARAEYVAALIETKPIWAAPFAERRMGAVHLATPAALHRLHLDHELTERFGPDSAFHALCRRSAQAPFLPDARRAYLSIVDGELELLRAAAAAGTIPDGCATCDGLKAFIAEHRRAAELAELRKVVVEDGFAFDLVFPLLRFGFYDPHRRLYSRSGLSEERLRQNLNRGIENAGQHESALLAAAERLADPKCRAVVKGKGGLGMNFYERGALAPACPSLVRLIGWIREHPPEPRERGKIETAAAVSGESVTPAGGASETALPFSKAQQFLVRIGRAAADGAAAPAQVRAAGAVIAEFLPLAAHTPPKLAADGVRVLLEFYSAIRTSANDRVKEQTLELLESIGANAAEGARELVRQSGSPDLITRRLASGILMQAAPRIVDAAASRSGFPAPEEVIGAVFEYIEKETHSAFKRHAAESFFEVVRGHGASWEVVERLRATHPLASTYLTALLEGLEE